MLALFGFRRTVEAVLDSTHAVDLVSMALEAIGEAVGSISP